MTLSAMDDQGKAVDWWFMYKISKNSKSSSPINGTEYIYFDSNGVKSNKKLSMSSDTVDKNGCLVNTLNQIYQENSPDLGWWFYNDDNPISKETSNSLGHCKGVVAFDLAENTAFWLISSIPLFPPEGQYSYPNSGEVMAQTLLCITLENASVTQKIAEQMCAKHQPQVYLTSEIPSALNPTDSRVFLMKKPLTFPPVPVVPLTQEDPLRAVPFSSKAGQKFMSIAKNKNEVVSFYNDIVGTALNINLEVETWECDPLPKLLGQQPHQVVAMNSVDLNPIGINIQWSETDDHAKLAISDKKESIHWVCVGDINFTEAQEKRGGGTVAFQCEPLWQGISSILSSVKIPPK